MSEQHKWIESKEPSRSTRMNPAKYWICQNCQSVLPSYREGESPDPDILLVWEDSELMNCDQIMIAKLMSK